MYFGGPRLSQWQCVLTFSILKRIMQQFHSPLLPILLLYLHYPLFSFTINLKPFFFSNHSLLSMFAPSVVSSWSVMIMIKCLMIRLTFSSHCQLCSEVLGALVQTYDVDPLRIQTRKHTVALFVYNINQTTKLKLSNYIDLLLALSIRRLKVESLELRRLHSDLILT